jgi:hypothetical protein
LKEQCLPKRSQAKSGLVVAYLFAYSGNAEYHR